MTIQLLTQPAYEPVSLTEARLWCRLESDDTINTPTLTLLIKAMREHAENLTHRAFIQRSLRQSQAYWESDPRYGYRITLQCPPVASVESVKYIDSDGTLTTLATDQYVLHNECEPAFIIPAYQVTWPTLRSTPNSVQVTYTAGYTPGSPSDEASNQEVIPAELRLWMQTRISTLFENREQMIVGTIVSQLPRSFADGLLDSLVIGTRLF